MDEFKPRRCRECGKGTISPRTRADRKERYRNLMIAVPSTFPIPTCDVCQSEWMDESTAKALDRALEATLRDELRKRVNAAIGDITKHISQRRLETLIGVSAGYISKLKRGEREPSPELVSELALVAKNPKERIRELERYWGPLLASEKS